MSQVIDIRGPQGNAFALMSIARSLANQLNLDGNKIVDEMQSGGYDNLIRVFSEHFGSVVDIVGYTDPDEDDDWDDDDDEDDDDDDYDCDADE